MSLRNPWPPTPPQMPSSSLASSVDDLTAVASCVTHLGTPKTPLALTASPTLRKPGETDDGRFIRAFSLIADQTPMLFMIAYVISR